MLNLLFVANACDTVPREVLDWLLPLGFVLGFIRSITARTR